MVKQMVFLYSDVYFVNENKIYGNRKLISFLKIHNGVAATLHAGITFMKRIIKYECERKG